MAVAEDIIRVRIEVEDQIPGLGKAKKEINGLAALGKAAGKGIGAAMTGAFALAAGAAGVGLLAKGIAGLHSELQGAEFGLASLISALGGGDITSSLKSAREQVRGLKEDAAKGVGELQDYTRGFQQILAPTKNAGATMTQIRELNKLALAAGFALDGQLGLQSVSRDVAQAMDQGVGQMTTPIVNKLLPAIGLTNAQFNKLSKRDRFDALTRAFGTMAAGAELMGTGWEAQTATLQDGIKSVVMELTKPVFDVWVSQLKRANEWMEKNREAMREMAEVWGPRIAGAWETVSSNGQGAGALGAGAIGAAGAGGFVRAGGVAAISTATGAGTVASGGILVGVMAAVGLAFMGVTGALAEFPGLMKLTTTGIAMVSFAFGDLMVSLGTLNQKGSILNRVGGILVGGFALGIIIFAKGIMVVAAGIKFLGNRFLAMGKVFDAVATGNFTKAASLARNNGFGAATVALKNDIVDALTKPLRITKVRTNATGEGDEEGAGVKKPDAPVTNIGKIEVTVKAEVNADPNRVAVAFSEVLARANEFRKQARTAPLSPRSI